MPLASARAEQSVGGLAIAAEPAVGFRRGPESGYPVPMNDRGISGGKSCKSIPRHRRGLPLIGNALGVMRDPIRFQRRGHVRYGPVFSATIFSQKLAFVDPLGAPEFFEEIVRAPIEDLSMIEAYKQLFGRIVGPELFIEVDRALRHGLSLKYIRRHLEATARFVPEALRGLLSEDRGEVDGLMVANDLVFHVVSHYILGPVATARSGPELARLMHLLESDFSVFGMMFPVETPSARRRTQAFARLMEIVDTEVRLRLAESGEHDDFLNYAIQNLLADPTRPSSAEMRLLVLRCLGVMFGAHTNTSMSIAAGLLDLLDHPLEFAAVNAEVDALEAGVTPDVEALRGLVRLYAAINETLRRRSTGGIWRRAQRDLRVGDYTLSAGSLIGASMGLVNLDPRRYPEPMAYRPGRYVQMELDSYQSPPVNSTPVHFGAFGTGRGLCSGRPLAYTLIGLIMVELLRAYEWRVVARPKRWFNVLTGGLSRPIGKLRLHYRRRVNP